MIKYRTNWQQKIEPQEVERETPTMVVLLDGSKESKQAEWHAWHNTWEDAHAFLTARAQAEVDSLRLRLEQAKGKLGNIKGMKPPTQ